MKDKTKLQTKPAVDREAVRVLAIEIGAREAARRVGIKESTVLSWASRYNWKLPKRKGGATLKNATAVTLRSTPGDALIAVHADHEESIKINILKALQKTAEQAARNPALDVKTVAQLRDLASAYERMSAKSPSQVATIYNNPQAVICDEVTRMRLIAARDKMLKEKSPTVDGSDTAVTADTVEPVIRQRLEPATPKLPLASKTLRPPPTSPDPVALPISLNGIRSYPAIPEPQQYEPPEVEGLPDIDDLS